MNARDILNTAYEVMAAELDIPEKDQKQLVDLEEAQDWLRKIADDTHYFTISVHPGSYGSPALGKYGG